MIEDYNEAVREAQIGLEPCAYLHNYRVAPANDPLLDERYSTYLEKAPVFCRGDVVKLRDFICGHITRPDDGRVLYEIESGRLRPSKSLQDALSSMLEGNDEFVMIDDQKVIFETALSLARRSRETGEKHVLIVRGGPGTGKSVVAINLLVRLTAADMVCQYVSKNSAPRNVYSALLRARRPDDDLHQRPVPRTGQVLRAARRLARRHRRGRGAPAEREVRLLRQRGREPDGGAHRRRPLLGLLHRREPAHPHQGRRRDRRHPRVRRALRRAPVGGRAVLAVPVQRLGLVPGLAGRRPRHREGGGSARRPSTTTSACSTTRTS